jgi:riboflavin kinase/FMN adenylyltransferase
MCRADESRERVVAEGLGELTEAAVLVGLDALSGVAASAVTIGTFDGVHVGHRALIGRAVERAREFDIEAVALSWDRHPNETLRPERVPPLLTTPERKIELLRSSGVGVVAVLSFDEELSHWPPERFVDDVLGAGLHARSVVVGRGWRFGHKAAGDVALLARLGEERGFEVDELPLIEVQGEAVSSSRVRAAVASGDVALARLLLGRPFEYEGIVVRGDDRGAALGFPTANVEIDASLAHPPRGVYACTATVDDVLYTAAVNVGVNPTFGGVEGTTPLRVEAFLLDFDGDLYGGTLRIAFLERLRDEERFAGPDELIAQITQDVEATRKLVSGERGST